MAEKISRWKKFKRFLKRNMTPLWAMRFSYQVLSFIIAVGMVFLVANYAFTKSYDSWKLSFVEGFTITAHSGAFNTPDNSMEFVEKAIENKVEVIEIDIRMRPDDTVVMGHDIITTNSGGVEVASVFDVIKDKDILINLDIKDTRVLPGLHDLIFEYGVQDKVFMTGIEPFQAKTAAEKCPDIDYYINYVPSRIKIFSDDYQQKLLDMLEETGGIGINCHHRNASRTLSEMLHNNGYKLSVWTVDRPSEMKRALVNKPDNITTKKVDELRYLIEHWGKK